MKAYLGSILGTIFALLAPAIFFATTLLHETFHLLPYVVFAAVWGGASLFVSREWKVSQLGATALYVAVGLLEAFLFFDVSV